MAEVLGRCSRLETPEGKYPVWKGTFWPTVISDSSLSVASTCGVEMTFTSELDCSARMRTPSEGSETAAGQVLEHRRRSGR